MDENLDELLGITRCARCGQRLEGSMECPFCSLFPDKPYGKRIPKWVYVTACFLTFPLSIPFFITSKELKPFEKLIIATGLGFWLALYFYF
ncbi:MAG TPA: hypothetical protein VN944_04315 [Nitrospiria bacterium]|nr:hypothetical protein [Nitrospiria bacterium]